LRRRRRLGRRSRKQAALVHARHECPTLPGRRLLSSGPTGRIRRSLSSLRRLASCCGGTGARSLTSALTRPPRTPTTTTMMTAAAQTGGACSLASGFPRWLAQQLAAWSENRTEGHLPSISTAADDDEPALSFGFASGLGTPPEWRGACPYVGGEEHATTKTTAHIAAAHAAGHEP